MYDFFFPMTLILPVGWPPDLLLLTQFSPVAYLKYPANHIALSWEVLLYCLNSFKKPLCVWIMPGFFALPEVVARYGAFIPSILAVEHFFYSVFIPLFFCWFTVWCNCRGVASCLVIHHHLRSSAALPSKDSSAIWVRKVRMWYHQWDVICYRMDKSERSEDFLFNTSFLVTTIVFIKSRSQF